MRSVDAAYSKQLARLDFKAAWDFRLVDQDGKVYPLPPKAILNRSRSGEIDGGTWRLSLSIAADRLPSGVDPQQYHQIQADRLVAGTAYPYFRGVIDKAERGWRKDGGAAVESLEVEAFGVLQKAKGYRISSISVDPAVGVATNPEILTGISVTRRYAPGTVAFGGTVDKLPAGPTAGVAAGYLTIYTDATLSTTYTEGVDYTADASAVPVTITWINPANDTRVIEYLHFDRIVLSVLRRHTAGAIDHVILPYGRDPNDLFQTFVAATGSSGGYPTITPADATGWSDRMSTLTSEERILVTTTDGTEHILRVHHFDGSGVAYLDEAIPAGVAVGDPARVCTTEGYAAWDDDRLYRFYDASIGGNEWNRRLLQAYPNLGIVIPAPRDWTENVYSRIYFIDETNTSNRVEEVLKEILTTSTGLFDAADVETEYTGAICKNYSRAGIDLADVIAEFKEQALPPNAFIHDTPEGTIAIKPYRQATSPDWTLRGVTSITETETPEPVTAVTVIAEGEEINKAPGWFYSSDNLTNPSYAIDNNVNTQALPSSTSTSATITFRIPKPTPDQAYPTISRLRVTGRGLLTVYVTRPDGDTYYLPGAYRPMDSGAVEIPGEELIKALRSALSEDYLLLSIQVDPYTTGDTGYTVETAAYIAEVEILTNQAGAWRAALTDDTSLAPADGPGGADGFGLTWVQPDSTLPESYRYAPTSYLKRVSVRYDSVGSFAPRHLVMRRTGISQQDCRDDSERWADEMLRAGKTYRITAPLDDRAELGDTFRAFTPDGEALDLLLWGLADQGAPGDTMAEYTGIDYSL